MDNLPPEVLLKIAGYCDFAEVRALTKVNKQWNVLVEANWKLLKKANVECIVFRDLYYYTWVQCVIKCKDDRRKSLDFIIGKGSEIVDASELLETGWSHNVPHDFFELQHLKASDVEKFLKNLFTPIFQSSAISHLELSRVRLETLQVLISLLERFLPTITKLEMDIGSQCEIGEYICDVKELTDSARIVELSKTDQLDFRLRDSFSSGQVHEHFMEKIANLYIPRVIMKLFDLADYGRDYKRIREEGQGLLPKCRYLYCHTDVACFGTAALDVPDILVDLVEEWSKNERDIVHYEFKYSEDYPSSISFDSIPERFAQTFKESNLQIRFEVVQENTEFLIKKIATRGDNQDELRVNFSLRPDYPGADELSAFTYYAVFQTNEDVIAHR